MNEIKNDTNLTTIIRDSVLGTDWEVGDFINTNNDFHHNCLFWNKLKFGLKRQFSISSVLRDIIAYELYYRQNPLPLVDTVFFTLSGALILDEERTISGTKEIIQLDNSTASGLLLLVITDNTDEQAVIELVR